MDYDKIFKKYYSEAIVLGIIFLFFFQQITDFVESIYLLNLIETDINENIAAVLFLLTPLLLLAFKRNFPDKMLVLVVEIMAICRILYPFFDTQLKMILTGLGVGCFMIFLHVYIKKRATGNHEKNGLSLGLALSSGLILSIVLRTLGSSIDLSLIIWFQWIGWILAAYVMIMAMFLLHSDETNGITENDINVGEKQDKWKLWALCLGLMSILTLCYFAFSSPTVIARWSEGNIITITTILILAIAAFIIIAYLKPHFFSKLSLKIIIPWNVVFILMLILTIGLNQIPFILISSYPYYAPETTIIHHVILYTMLISSLIIFIDFTLLTRQIFSRKPSVRSMGASFSLSALYLILMIFSAVFVPVWDYIPIIGPFFRDMLWLVFLIVGIVLILPIILIKKTSFIFIKSSREEITIKLKKLSVIALIIIGTIIGGSILEIPFIQSSTDTNTLRILTYNIQQGASDDGKVNFEGQRALIQSLNPDIIGLQESDSARIANGNKDFVRYISNTLGYYSYYGPKTVTSTFGIALLSKYPISNARTFYMESVGEQAATIWAQITVGTTTFNVFVTHLGNYKNASTGDTTQLVQQQNILTVAAGKKNVLLMGDFNFESNTLQYNITVLQFYDAWELVSASNPSKAVADSNLPGGREIPAERIDHLFVSHQLNESLTSIHYTGGFESDHPALFATMNIVSI